VISFERGDDPDVGVGAFALGGTSLVHISATYTLEEAADALAASGRRKLDKIVVTTP
jgi:hypothetical protein